MSVKEILVSRIDVATNKIEQKTDYVADETPLHLFLNKTHYTTILCFPAALKELAVGHLLSEGVLKSVDEIQQIRFGNDGKCDVRVKPNIDVEKRVSVSQPFTRLVLSACGSPDYWPLSKLIDRLAFRKIPLGLTVKAKVIMESVRYINVLAEIFRKTGGVHIAALYSPDGEKITYAEDVGRHNAADKVIGTAALRKVKFNQVFLASSGRLTGDIVLKAARMEIPIVASMTAALNSGVEAAQRTGVTLIGFVRGTRMNIYTYPERIIVTT